MEVLNEDFGELLHEQKIFYEHINGLQNKAGFLIECLNRVRREFSGLNSVKVSEKVGSETQNQDEVRTVKNDLPNGKEQGDIESTKVED